MESTSEQRLVSPFAILAWSWYRVESCPRTSRTLARERITHWLDDLKLCLLSLLSEPFCARDTWIDGVHTKQTINCRIVWLGVDELRSPKLLETGRDGIGWVSANAWSLAEWRRCIQHNILIHIENGFIITIHNAWKFSWPTDT